MIDYIKGRIDSLSATYVVVETGGIGYEINISLLDYTALEGREEAKLYIHESIRDDAHVLFGFLDARSRFLFRQLIGVSGVGPNTARLILSAMTADQLESAIATGNDSVLRAVKGIGGKTAQRIIVDLKDKINSISASLITSQGGMTESHEDALSALLMLGFTSAGARKALQKVFSAHPDLSTEGAIKEALKIL